MKRTNIYLDENLDRLIRYLAVQQGRSFTDIVREALNDYAKAQGYPDPSRIRMPLPMTKEEREEWRVEMKQLLQEIRESVETNLTPDEIEDLITAASNEARQVRLSEHLTAHG
ncbi:MAG TPA: CopG family transcriptional regulator [Thermomicrobiales bacterium]|nr:CopG family transcriptional regulator [Thermomicrobiales bacterium]